MGSPLCSVHPGGNGGTIVGTGPGGGPGGNACMFEAVWRLHPCSDDNDVDDDDDDVYVSGYFVQPAVESAGARAAAITRWARDLNI